MDEIKQTNNTCGDRQTIPTPLYATILRFVIGT